MDDVSVKLYKYMCDEVVGSEKVVDYRRQFFNVLDDVYNHSGSNHMYNNCIQTNTKGDISHELCAHFTSFFFGKTRFTNYQYVYA
jgi:hypothetical protein